MSPLLTMILFYLLASFACVSLATGNISQPKSVSPRQHFETIMMSGEGSQVCPASNTWCFVVNDFNALNRRSSGTRGVYMSVKSALVQLLDQEVAQNGNGVAYYMNDMNLYRNDGANTAKRMWGDACRAFGGCGNVPKWWFLNEIISEQWLESSYQSWIVGFVRVLAHKYKVHPVIAVSIERSTQYDPTSAKGLRAIVRNGGYLGLELYQTGQQVVSSGFSMHAVRAFYAQGMNYIHGQLRVPKSRIMMWEHYGNTKAGNILGRTGISKSHWVRAIKLRNRAIATVGFAGTITYGWWNNDMRDTAHQRNVYYAAHLSTRGRLP